MSVSMVVEYVFPPGVAAVSFDTIKDNTIVYLLVTIESWNNMNYSLDPPRAALYQFSEPPTFISAFL